MLDSVFQIDGFYPIFSPYKPNPGILTNEPAHQIASGKVCKT